VPTNQMDRDKDSFKVRATSVTLESPVKVNFNNSKTYLTFNKTQGLEHKACKIVS